jgi:hypothetical protein
MSWFSYAWNTIKRQTRAATATQRALAASPDYKDPTKDRGSTAGLAPEALDSEYYWGADDISTTRTQLYAEMEEMEATMPEASRALDILADNAVSAPKGVRRTFTIRFDEGETEASEPHQQIIRSLIDRLQLQEKSYAIARDTLKYGDNFLQVIVGNDLHVNRLMYMAPNSMRRNEDQQGLLKTGRGDSAAFEQFYPSTSKRIAWFYPWQIAHLRWNRAGGSKYGKPLLAPARYPFKKLQSMEEALVINWLTRAFARLLFEVDVSGKTPQEAQAYLQAFMRNLKQRSRSESQSMAHRLTVAKDLVIGKSYRNQGGKFDPSLDKISIVDTSNTGFWNITAVEYWREKLITATGIPKAHLGIEKDVNSRSTLQWQDERLIARMVRRIQVVLSELVHHLITLELILQGIDPDSVHYVLEWPEPSLLDDLERSQMAENYAAAAERLIKYGVADQEWIAIHWLGMTPNEWKAVKGRIGKWNPPSSGQT